MTLTLLVGPTGVGKTTIWEFLARHHELIPFKTCTTRKIREKEQVKGYIPQYRFLTDTEFVDMIDKDYFFEHIEHIGKRYGTSKLDIEAAIADSSHWVGVVDIRGAISVKEAYPEVLTIFIHAPSSAELAKRILDRGSETTEEMAERIAIAYEREIPNAGQLDAGIINSTIEQSAFDVLKLIEKNHS